MGPRAFSFDPLNGDDPAGPSTSHAVSTGPSETVPEERDEILAEEVGFFTYVTIGREEEEKRKIEAALSSFSIQFYRPAKGYEIKNIVKNRQRKALRMVMGEPDIFSPEAMACDEVVMLLNIVSCSRPYAVESFFDLAHIFFPKKSTYYDRLRVLRKMSRLPKFALLPNLASIEHILTDDMTVKDKVRIATRRGIGVIANYPDVFCINERTGSEKADYICTLLRLDEFQLNSLGNYSKHHFTKNMSVEDTETIVELLKLLDWNLLEGLLFSNTFPKGMLADEKISKISTCIEARLSR